MPSGLRSALSLEQRAAAQALEALATGQRLDAALARAYRTLDIAEASASAVRDMASHAARRLGTCRALSRLLSPREPTPAVAALQWLGFSQLIEPRRREATIVDQAVEAARSDPRTRAAAGFLNATLRAFLREPQRLLEQAREDPEGRWNHPRWWIEALRRDHPEQWQAILEAAADPPPLTLRLNHRHTDADDYLGRLAALGMQGRRIGADALVVEPACSVHELPGWAAGWVSVQDEGAQRAALWLDVAPGQRVLDACAAPGGKSAHLLEREPIRLTAVEIDPERLERMAQGLARLSLRAELVCADAAQPQRWWNGEPYDRILVDAPCTASGIVRRAPDARWLRRRSDLATFAQSQRRLLDKLWPLLAPGGKLLYVTCSVFDAEGADVARSFLQDHADAAEIALPEEGASLKRPGLQLLPVRSARRDHDGFYYCLLRKRR